MRRNWLANAALATVAISVPVGALSGTAHAATLGQQKTVHHKVHKLKHQTKKRHYSGRHRRPESFNQVAATLAKTFEGDPYMYGGTSPAGFDCSGLTQYVYRHTGHGKHIKRTAEDQFLEFKPVSHGHAVPGDLVFFHESSDPDSYVYHVGVYEGGEHMVAATTYGEGVQYQSFAWAGDTVTFGALLSPGGPVPPMRSAARPMAKVAIVSGARRTAKADWESAVPAPASMSKRPGTGSPLISARMAFRVTWASRRSRAASSPWSPITTRTAWPPIA